QTGGNYRSRLSPSSRLCSLSSRSSHRADTARSPGGWSRPARLRRWSLARRLFVLQVVVVAVVVLAGAGLAWYDASRRTHREATEEVAAVARTLASLPEVRRAVRGPEPSRALQPLAEQARAETEVAFITIMSPAGVRYTH